MDSSGVVLSSNQDGIPREAMRMENALPSGLISLIQDYRPENGFLDRELELNDVGKVHIRIRPLPHQLLHICVRRVIPSSEDDLVEYLKKRIEDRETVFQNTLKVLPGAFIQYQLNDDGTDRITNISEKCRDLWGVEPQHALNDPSTIWNLVEDNDVSGMVGSIRESAENLTLWNHQYRITTPQGVQKWIHALGQPYREGDNVIWQTMAFDITDQMENESQREMLASAADKATNAIMITDPTARIEWVNKAFTDMTGYELDEIQGMRPDDFLHGERTSMSDVERILEVMKLDHGGIVEILNYTKQGQAFWNEIHISPIFDDEGKIIRYIAIETDITQRKVDEDRMRTSLKLTEAQNERLKNFNYIVSHNLQSQAANIKALVSEFVDKDDMVGNLLDQSASNLMDTLANLSEILQVQKSTALPRQPLNLRKNIEDILTNLHQQIMDSGAEFDVDVAEDVDIPFYPAYYESIFFNLISNAIKYRSPDRPLRVKISYTEVDGGYLVKVADNGLGIDMKLNGDKLFGMYKTFHEHPDAKGFGLYITKSQMEALGGAIKAESEVGVGTTFYLLFPSLV